MDMANIAPLVCGTVATCAGLVAFCVRPDQGPMVLAIVSPAVSMCAAAWQASRSQKQS